MLGDKYHIWSNEHCSWWRANSNGYTIHRGEAGIYSREKALEICFGANAYRSPAALPKEIPVLVQDAHVISGGE